MYNTSLSYTVLWPRKVYVARRDAISLISFYNNLSTTVLIFMFRIRVVGQIQSWSLNMSMICREIISLILIWYLLMFLKLDNFSNLHLKIINLNYQERGAVGETILHLCLLNATSLLANLGKRLLRFYPKLINDIYMSDEYYGKSISPRKCWWIFESANL